MYMSATLIVLEYHSGNANVISVSYDELFAVSARL